MVQDWLNIISADLNQGPVEARLVMTDGKLSINGSGSDGKALDGSVTASKIKDAVQSFVVNQSNDKTISVIAIIKVTKPDVTEANLSSFGIIEQVGIANTTFVGSPDNRKHNITVGANALSGIIIKPGEEFSTLKNLGKIDQSTGYLPELVIKVNKTVPEYGGGLCQVSTTLFRAAMNSGLKITERQNHRYRVSYYEPPVGMDATIYEGSPDFKFVNTYTNSILVQSSVVGTKITFEIFGKKDGRTVNIPSPSVYDVVNPPDAEYTDTDTLPEGTTKKIESAHPGASASFIYTVFKSDGSVMNKQTFVSKYVPWQAKYLRGTAKPADATPTLSATP
jgi:vancomycin resistance protein YoaR